MILGYIDAASGSMMLQLIWVAWPQWASCSRCGGAAFSLPAHPQARRRPPPSGSGPAIRKPDGQVSRRKTLSRPPRRPRRPPSNPGRFATGTAVSSTTDGRILRALSEDGLARLARAVRVEALPGDRGRRQARRDHTGDDESYPIGERGRGARARAHPVRLLPVRVAVRDAPRRGAPPARAASPRARRRPDPQGLLALQRAVARRAARCSSTSARSSGCAPGEPWSGYRQFCMLFLNPLLLQAYKGIAFQPWLRGSLAGIAADRGSALMSFRDLFRRGRPDTRRPARAARAQARGDDRDVKGELRKRRASRRSSSSRTCGGSRSSCAGSTGSPGSHGVVGLRRDDLLRRGRRRAQGGVRPRGRAQRASGARCGTSAATKAATRASPPRTRATSSRSTGTRRSSIALYRALPSEGGRDPAARRRRDRPLACARLARRSSGSTLEARGAPDLTLCLAVLHHVAISGNVPVPEFLSWLAGLGTRARDRVSDPRRSARRRAPRSARRQAPTRTTTASPSSARSRNGSASSARRSSPVALASSTTPCRARIVRCRLHASPRCVARSCSPLSGFALAQPLFDILGKNAEFFAVRGSTPSDIVLFALAVTFVPAVVLLLIEVRVGARERAGRARPPLRLPRRARRALRGRRR